MNIELDRREKRIAISLLLVSASTIYLGLTTLQFAAAEFSRSGNARVARLALKLDPTNAEYYENLAKFERGDNQSPQPAITLLNRATALNPNRAGYWVERASAERMGGDLAAARESLNRAESADPRSAGIAWEAANLDFAQGDGEKALGEYRRVMENEPPLLPQAIGICWSMHPDVDSLLDDVVPPNADQAFLNFLIANSQTEAAAKVWQRIVVLQQPVSRPFVFDYLQYLLAKGEAVDATRVWQEAANVAELAAYQASEENLIINGDFSLDMLNGGFDWIFQRTSVVTLALDPLETHASSRSLRIFFEGPGIVDAGIRQIVAVEPNTQYEFSGFYKAEEMDGAGGPRFAIQDLYSETALFMSDDLRNADFWTKVNGTFTTGPDTRLVVLRIARVPAGSPIRGKLWIDDLRLVTAEHAASIQKERS